MLHISYCPPRRGNCEKAYCNPQCDGSSGIFQELFTCVREGCTHSKSTSWSGKRSFGKNIRFGLRKGTLPGCAAASSDIYSNKNPKHQLSECFSYGPFYWDAIRLWCRKRTWNNAQCLSKLSHWWLVLKFFTEVFPFSDMSGLKEIFKNSFVFLYLENFPVMKSKP